MDDFKKNLDKTLTYLFYAICALAGFTAGFVITRYLYEFTHNHPIQSVVTAATIIWYCRTSKSLRELPFYVILMLLCFLGGIVTGLVMNLYFYFAA